MSTTPSTPSSTDDPSPSTKPTHTESRSGADAGCAACGYSLAGLDGSICPECGVVPTAENTAAPLGKRAATGFMLLSGQNLITRAITLGAQIVLAKLLFPNDFGLFAVAQGVVSFVAVLQQIGIREVLIARHERFHRWASIGLWISGAVALVGCVVIAVAAFVAAWYYQDSRLTGLMLVLALSQPLFSFTIVHEAKLQIDLRFKELAGFNLVQGAMVPLLMMGCAWLGWGAYAFVLPRLAAGVVRVAMLCSWVSVPLDRDPRWNRWKYMLMPGMIVLLTALVNNVGAAAPALVLGKMCGQEVAGYFAFAFNITMQGVVLLGSTLDNVMFPTLGRLQGEPARQKQAYLRATRALAAAMVPLCVAQALLARPLFSALFGSKWDHAVPIMQILSIGTIYYAVFIPAGSLLMAHSRFKARLWVGSLWAGVFLVLALVGAYRFGAEGVAAALSVAYLFSGLHIAASAMRPIGGGWKDALAALLPSHCVAGVASGAAVWVLSVLPHSTLAENLVQLAGAGAAFGLVYALLLRIAAPEVWSDLLGPMKPILRRLGLSRDLSGAKATASEGR